ncbi:MAG: YhdH/YhfP family quinone oxidoreductase [Gammaproteobacteria bacterium]|jgi:acrylyl-CoA reductase (NADPH)
MGFKAFRVEKNESGFSRSVVDRDESELPEGELLIEVKYSSLNFKDGLSATGNPGVTRNFPHTPGIDAAGVVLESTHSDFVAGDEIIAIGFDLGMGTSGGFAQRIRIPASWAVKCPQGLSLHASMIIGTAGFTAAECVQKLEQAGMTPASGPVLVTGATGGVGSVAVKLLGQLGYQVTAVTGKAAKADWLKSLGAAEVISREDAAAGAEKPLLPETWGGVVDTVGGDILFNGVKSLRYGCSLAACGLVAAPTFGASVLPFILRHVNLLGIDSVQLPIEQKAEIWQRLATDWLMDLSELEEALTLDTLSDGIDRILAGQMVGRGVVHL